MNTNEILLICRQLEVSGKTPSVALVKARMSGPKVLPVIVSGIKQYMSMPEEAKANLDNELKTTATKAANDTQTKNPSDTLLQNEITSLKQETAFLKKELADLQRELNIIRNDLSILTEK